MHSLEHAVVWSKCLLVSYALDLWLYGTHSGDMKSNEWLCPVWRLGFTSIPVNKWLTIEAISKTLNEYVQCGGWPRPSWSVHLLNGGLIEDSSRDWVCCLYARVLRYVVLGYVLCCWYMASDNCFIYLRVTNTCWPVLGEYRNVLLSL